MGCPARAINSRNEKETIQPRARPGPSTPADTPAAHRGPAYGTTPPKAARPPSPWRRPAARNPDHRTGDRRQGKPGKPQGALRVVSSPARRLRRHEPRIPAQRCPLVRHRELAAAGVLYRARPGPGSGARQRTRSVQCVGSLFAMGAPKSTLWRKMTERQTSQGKAEPWWLFLLWGDGYFGAPISEE